MEIQQSQFERYRTEIYRIGWKIQYRAKKIRYKEIPIFEDEKSVENFTTQLEDKIIIEELIQDIPLNGKEVLKRIYLEGYTEKEVAIQLKISQQAVSKWKKKMINLLSQKMSLQNC
ncbi:sigma-70 family RNA polymerase sigma factor [Paenibacillus polymyxa]